MSGFTPDWLQLRETADHRARCAYTDELRAVSASRWQIVDLGCGTGSNLRFLSAVLPGPQDWICIDHDEALLDALAQQPKPDRVASVTPRHADLADDIDALLEDAFARADARAQTLVAASALLDLVSADWIDAVALSCARHEIPALFALTYDGRIRLDPQSSEDESLRALVNAHQRNDKGFGPALGPRAPRYARAAFERCGHRVFEAASDWRLDADDADLQRDLLAGWVAAAREHAGDRHGFGEWSAQRRAQIDAGKLQTCVGHQDLLAIPAGRSP